MILRRSILFAALVIFATFSALVLACYTAPLSVSAGITSVQRLISGAHYRQLTLDSGVTIAYVDSDVNAPADRPVMLLLHGITSDKDIWLQMLREFPEFRVIALDMPGHGDSIEPRGFDYRVESLSAQLVGFIDALSLPPVHLVGNSLGGLVAALYSVDHSDRVRTLVLMNSAGIDAPEKTALMQRAMTDRSYNPLLVNSKGDIAGKLAAVLAVPPSLPDPAMELMLAKELNNLDANKMLFDAVLGDESNMQKLEGLLPKVSNPTLLLWGDNDQVFHPSSVTKASLIVPELSTHIIANCGHLPMIEAVPETVSTLKMFFAYSNLNEPRTRLLNGADSER